MKVVEDSAAERKQFASPGNGMPWLLAYGVRDIYGVGKGFIATRGRRPAVLVNLTPPSRFVRLLASVADPQPHQRSRLRRGGGNDAVNPWPEMADRPA